MKRPSPVLIYSASRFLLFSACAMALYWVGARSLLLFVLAFAVSGLLSYVLLGGQRDEMAAVVARRASSIGNRLDKSTTAEDDPPATG